MALIVKVSANTSTTMSRARQRLSEWSKTEESKQAYQKVAQEMRKDMSRADDKFTDMEVALTDEWLKQGKLKDLTFADAIEYGYKQAQQDYIEYAQLWVDSGEVNIKSFKQFLKDRGYE